MNFDIGPYDPCPCGSGAKYKFCCAAKAKANRHGKFPIGTVCYYGPDDRQTTKVAAGVVFHEGAAPGQLERWMAADASHDPKIAEEVKRFFAKYGVKSVVVTDGNIGCPHEEGIDFPNGQECPFCPFWRGKQGIGRRDEWMEDRWYEDDVDDDDDDDDDDEDHEKEDEEVAAGIIDVQATGPVASPIRDRDWDAQFARVAAILEAGRSGDDPAVAEMETGRALEILLNHLQANLQFPFEVTGIEDFQWEERYVIGGWSPREYKRLKKTQPSYTDRYMLLSIDRRESSKWMLIGNDIAARVRRNSDDKRFTLGLSELKATDKTSPNFQLLDDFAVWFVNNR